VSRVNKALSSPITTNTEAPQGSTISPVLFTYLVAPSHNLDSTQGGCLCWQSSCLVVDVCCMTKNEFP